MQLEACQLRFANGLYTKVCCVHANAYCCSGAHTLITSASNSVQQQQSEHYADAQCSEPNTDVASAWLFLYELFSSRCQHKHLMPCTSSQPACSDATQCRSQIYTANRLLAKQGTSLPRWEAMSMHSGLMHFVQCHSQAQAKPIVRKA